MKKTTKRIGGVRIWTNPRFTLDANETPYTVTRAGRDAYSEWTIRRNGKMLRGLTSWSETYTASVVRELNFAVRYGIAIGRARATASGKRKR